LLILVAHAFLVSATHFHRTERVGKSLAAFSLSAEDFSKSDGGLESNSHAQCLLCRLQRNFVAELSSPASFSAVALQKLPAKEISSASAHSNGAFLLPAGRAPPLV
jgi:hypothetical protein